jgi:hypothetical protein
MQEEFKAKNYRLLKPELFLLDKKKVWLATETPGGYVLKIDEDTRIGFPKSIVEKSRKLFREYNYHERRTYNRFRTQRPRLILIKNNNQCLKNRNNIV